jgi:hypothetical protein
MMVFELFSIGGQTDEFPDMENLYVRFLYRNGTDPGDRLTTYALFNGTQKHIPFNQFLSGVSSFDVGTISEWCNICDGVSLFCSNTKYQGPSSDYTSGGGASVQPAVAGAIGAAVTLAVIGLAFLLAVLFGGIHFGKNEPKARTGTLGGFKGAEKMASDTDLAFAKGGARHERTGSWELRGKKTDVESQDQGVTPSTAGIVVRARDLTHPSENRDDDAISEIGHEPVKPREF